VARGKFHNVRAVQVSMTTRRVLKKSDRARMGAVRLDASSRRAPNTRDIQASGDAADDLAPPVSRDRRVFRHHARSRIWLMPAAVTALAVVGCGSQGIEVATCQIGKEVTCSCGDGRAGVQICDAKGKFGSCACPPPVACTSGITVSCTCTDGDRGTQTCASSGVFAVCVCAPPACTPNERAACKCSNGLGGAQVCNGAGLFGTCDCTNQEASHPPLVGVLDFPNPSPTVQVRVNHAAFWTPGANLGRNFYWDAWVAPRTSGNLISDGFGVVHALRWGPILQEGQLVFQGELSTAAGPVAFAAAEGPAPGEWGHHAITLIEDATLDSLPPTVFVYWNGICVGMTRFPVADRQAGIVGNGDGTLYAMGSLSGSLGGRLAAIRGLDQFSPFAQRYPMWAFLPERTFSPWVRNTPVDFLADYTHRAGQIEDIAPLGYNGGTAAAPLRRHPGTFESLIPVADMPVLPQWVMDPEGPYGTVGQLPFNTHQIVPTPASPPARALVFDSFGRAGQNFVWQQVPTLGQTEGGSLGPQAWKAGIVGPPEVPAPFGIINGRAVYLERQIGLAWVDVHSTDQDVRIDRFRAGWGHGTTGIAFRVIDSKNWSFFFADQLLTVRRSEQPAQIFLGRIVAGLRKNDLTVTPATDNWTRIRVLASSAMVTVFVDDGRGGWTTLGSMADQVAPSGATGAGLAGAPSYPQAYSLWRADNFTVCSPGGC
jgi:hypothetical protein